MEEAFANALISGLKRNASGCAERPPQRSRPASSAEVLAEAVAAAHDIEAVDDSDSQPTDSQPRGSQPTRRRPRQPRRPGERANHRYKACEQRVLGKEAEAFRAKFKPGPQGRKKGWLNAFCVDRMGADCKDADLQAYGIRVKSAMSCVQRDRPLYREPRFRVTGNATVKRRKKLSMRERGAGGGTKQKCPELDEEVWHWFVNRLAISRTRVSQEELMDVGSFYKKVLLETHQNNIERGFIDPGLSANLPQIDNNWVDRWRNRYCVTYRTVNLRYKISRRVFLRRLKVFWLNCIRIRALWRAFHGPDVELRFIGLDQTPKWFNSIACW